MLDIKEKVVLADYSTMKVGGPADRFVTVHSKEELDEAMKLPRPFIIGNGSNVLFMDRGYTGTIIKLGEEFSYIEVEGDTIRAGAGALLTAVSQAALDAGLAGLEFACGIPGSVGGAVYMNAGAYDHSVSELLENKEGFGYRKSPYMDSKEVITEVVFHLHKGDKRGIKARMNDYTKRRKEKQPLNYPSCGSFFKRPEGYFAGQLIEEAGLKGITYNGVQVSEKHAGFIINIGGATTNDIIEVMLYVQRKVIEKCGVLLEPEVQIIYNEDSLRS